MKLLCVPVRAKTLKELEKKIRKSAKSADLFEIWADRIRGKIDADRIVRLTRKPLIIVNKSGKEKGKWEKSESARIAVLRDFIRAGAAYIDVGINTAPALLKKITERKGKSKIIVSYHNFNSAPSEKFLWEIVRRGFRVGADIVKIAVHADRTEDNLKILNILAKAGRKKMPVIALCMGPKGRISRLLGLEFGSYLTYVASDKKNATAPGQITLREFKELTAKL